MSQIHLLGDDEPLLGSEETPVPTSGKRRHTGTGIAYPNVNEVVIETSSLRRRGFSRLTGKMSKNVLITLIAVINVTTNVLMNVSLPILSGTMQQKEVGGDSYIVLVIAGLWFPILFAAVSLFLRYTVDSSVSLRPTANWKMLLLVGFSTTLNGIFVVFASLPSRTPPYLQAILATTVIPFTVICRFLVLRKGISIKRFVCTVVVLIGLFITVEPQIWKLPGSDESSNGPKSDKDRILWPLIFAVGFIPAAVNAVICEKELKKEETGSLSFIMWTQVFQILTLLPLFWVDFIPWFGAASSVGDFRDRLRNGLHCCFSSAGHCRGLAFKVWLFVLAYCAGNLFQFLLIEFAEGAIYAVVVQSLITPFAALFWTFFEYNADTDYFHWFPHFSMTTVFTICGLAIIMPAVIMYNYFSNAEEKEKLSNGSIQAKPVE